MTLDRVVNRRFSAQDAPQKISGSSHVVEQKCVGVKESQMQMPTWDTGSLSFESFTWVPAGRPAEVAVHGGPPVEYPGREAKEAPSGALKTTQHGMVKRRSSYGSIWQSPFVSLRPSLSLSLSLSHSHTHTHTLMPPLTPFENNVWELYFYN